MLSGSSRSWLFLVNAGHSAMTPRLGRGPRVLSHPAVTLCGSVSSCGCGRCNHFHLTEKAVSKKLGDFPTAPEEAEPEAGHLRAQIKPSAVEVTGVGRGEGGDALSLDIPSAPTHPRPQPLWERAPRKPMTCPQSRRQGVTSAEDGAGR